MDHDEPIVMDEAGKLKRIRELNPKLYAEILDLESKIYLDLDARMALLTEVKDLILAYDGKGARQRLKQVAKKIDPTHKRGPK